MAESDWGEIGANASAIRRGVTAFFAPPAGGGQFCFGFNAVQAGNLCAARYCNGVDFAPLRDDNGNATGGTISAALKRYTSPSALGYSIAIFSCLQGLTDSDYGYFLGLSNNDPHAIVLAKTSLRTGLQPDSTAILRTSSTTYLVNTWLHLRLDVIVNPNGDVVLKCFQNDLTQGSVASPIWTEISGMSDFIDDSLAIASGSNPLAGGYMGYGFWSENQYSRGVIDYVTVGRQM